MSDDLVKRGSLFGQRDATKWVDEFIRLHPSGTVDRGTLLGWFANAIETGVAVTSGLSTHEPSPVHNDSRPVWEMVIEDMKERDAVGRERYGTPLQANNGRDALVDAYQEALDLVVYLRQAIAERDG